MTIGYYVHHQGDGHRRRALAIARHNPDEVVLLGTGLAGRTDGIACIDLPDDRPSEREPDEAHDESTRPCSLHYVPTGHDGIRRRVALVAGWIATARPSLLVVDVSVEIAMLGRIASTPTVYVRLSGDRSDEPHLEAFRSARAILAPFHEDLDEPALPPWIREKTHYAPGLTDQHPAADAAGEVVLVVFGKGGQPGDADVLAQAAAATPGTHWRVIGPVTAATGAIPANLTILGWVETAQDEIARAGIIIGAAGDGLVTAALAADRPLICLAEPRPYGEQISKARRLAAMGAALAIEAWPAPGEWPALLSRARSLRADARMRLHDPDGAAKAAAFLRDCAAAATSAAPRTFGACS